MLAADLPQPESRRQRQALRANLQLLDTAGRLKEHWDLCARQQGLSGTQIKALLHLAIDERVTMRTLAGRLSYDASNLTGLIDRLEQAGLVGRHSDEADRRATQLSLTGKGRHVRDEFWRTLNASGPLDRLTTAQLNAITAALEDRPGPQPVAGPG